MDPIIPSYSWDRDEETDHLTKPKNTKEQQLFLKTRNGNIRSNGKLIIPRAEEGYCNEATQSLPLTHSQSHQAQNAVEHTEVKQRRAWTREEIREVVWCYLYCRQHFTENYKKMCETWRKRNPESRIYMTTKKLMNQKYYIMKHNKITEMEIEEIENELQKNLRSHLEEREEEELEHSGTIRDREQKPNTAFTAEEEMEIHQQRDQTHILKKN